MIANRRFSWHATLWQGRTHAREVETERRRLTRDQVIDERRGPVLLEDRFETVSCHVAFVLHEACQVIEK